MEHFVTIADTSQEKNKYAKKEKEHCGRRIVMKK